MTWFPSYGAEMRGGAATCTVVISDEPIGSPVVCNPDILIVMNTLSLDKYQSRVKKSGLLFYDSSLISRPALRTDISSVAVPATDLAGTVSTTRSANMIIFGALLARTRLLREQSLRQVFDSNEDMMKRLASRVDINTIYEGYKYFENKKSQNQGR